MKLKPLQSKPSARDVLLVVLSIGGHIKNNGDPGWMVIGRGYESLLLVERGNERASPIHPARCDRC